MASTTIPLSYVARNLWVRKTTTLLTLSGILRPLGGSVTVAHDQHGHIHLLYKSASVEDRMRFASKVSSFEDMVQKIWAEMQPATSSAS